MEAPSEVAFKALLRGNLIRSCPVQEKDVDLAFRIFGKDVAVLQGRSTRPTPLIPIDDSIEIPDELLENMNKDLELAIDMMFINKQDIIYEHGSWHNFCLYQFLLYII